MTKGFLCNCDEFSSFEPMNGLKTEAPVWRETEEMELRNALRYRLAASAVFRWESPAGGLLQGQGITRDISVKGAFILTANCPPTGIVLSVEIFLPQFRNGGPGGHLMKMVSEVQVVRVEHPVLGESQDGFAVVGEDFAIA
jgi:hypothetical protein